MDNKELAVTAAQAYLDLTAEEFHELGIEVSRILDYFSKMMELDVSGLEPTTHALLKNNRTRLDNNNSNNNPVDSNNLLNNVPELEDRFIVIPNVL